ncbi:unnamed protein product [Parajaminaea phylloscopi]
MPSTYLASPLPTISCLGTTCSEGYQSRRWSHADTDAQASPQANPARRLIGFWSQSDTPAPCSSWPGTRTLEYLSKHQPSSNCTAHGMASAQTAGSNTRPPAPAPPMGAHPDRRGGPSNAGGIPPHASPRSASHGRPAGTFDDVRGTKRRVSDEHDESRERYRHPSPPYNTSRGEERPPPSYATARNGFVPAYASPRTQLPPFNSISARPQPHPSEGSHDDLALRKRPAGMQDSYSDMRDLPRSTSTHPAYTRGEYADDERYARPQGPGGPGPHRAGPPSSHLPPMNGQPPQPYDERDYSRSSYAGPAQPSPLPSSAHPGGPDSYRSNGDEQYDSNVPLARRRGDAAQAKANKLHIDVGSAVSDRADFEPRHADRERVGPFRGGGPGGPLPPGPHRLGPPDGSLVARSAPPTRLSFSERDDAMDPRLAPVAGPPGAGMHAPPGHSASHSHSHGSLAYYPKPSGPQAAYREGPPQGQHGGPPGAYSPPNSGGRGTEMGGSPAMAPGGPGSVYGSLGPQQSAAPGPTPLTARFAPQTANLPSPAYNTTRLLQSGTGGGHFGGSGAGGVGGPRTAALPIGLPTSRLPDSLRSPPSSKTQFLSLFSNFYDSLQDSRTLKATLEDQVKRSNTLLQMLQKSSKVLEATVDRKIREERGVWEKRVKRLEAKVRRLEGGEGTESEDEASDAGLDDTAATAGADAVKSEADLAQQPKERVAGGGADSDVHRQGSADRTPNEEAAASGSAGSKGPRPASRSDESEGRGAGDGSDSGEGDQSTRPAETSPQAQSNRRKKTAG